jgi:hypothetical protein
VLRNSLTARVLGPGADRSYQQLQDAGAARAEMGLYAEDAMGVVQPLPARRSTDEGAHQLDGVGVAEALFAHE